MYILREKPDERLNIKQESALSAWECFPPIKFVGM
jgi:hypothetical protein